jgi:hypothetical protein
VHHFEHHFRPVPRVRMDGGWRRARHCENRGASPTDARGRGGTHGGRRGSKR